MSTFEPAIKTNWWSVFKLIIWILVLIIILQDVVTTIYFKNISAAFCICLPLVFIIKYYVIDEYHDFKTLQILDIHVVSQRILSGLLGNYSSSFPSFENECTPQRAIQNLMNSILWSFVVIFLCGLLSGYQNVFTGVDLKHICMAFGISLPWILIIRYCVLDDYDDKDNEYRANISFMEEGIRIKNRQKHKDRFLSKYNLRI